MYHNVSFMSDLLVLFTKREKPHGREKRLNIICSNPVNVWKKPEFFLIYIFASIFHNPRECVRCESPERPHLNPRNILRFMSTRPKLTETTMVDMTVQWGRALQNCNPKERVSSQLRHKSGLTNCSHF